MLEEGAVSAPADEVLDRLDFMDALTAVPELVPVCKVRATGLRRPLHAHGELAARPGRLYVPVKLRTNASSKLTHALMLPIGRLFNHVRADPWSTVRSARRDNDWHR